jgi:long-chain fatty acid transport protein
MSLWAVPAGADEGRAQDYVVGSRALALGGAFTAIANDSSGIFYNPAGIVDVRASNLSIATSLYGLELRGRDAISEGTTLFFSRGLSATDLIIFPSSTGAVIGLGNPLPSGRYRHAVSLGTVVPRYISRVSEWGEINEEVDTWTRSMLVDRTLHAGAAYAYRATPWLRMGLGLHYVLRTINAEESLTAHQVAQPENYIIVSSRLRAAFHSMRGAAGLKYMWGPRWRLGLSLTTPSLGVWRNTAFTAYRAAGTDDQTGEDFVPVNLTDSGLWGPSQEPAQARAGLAFQEPQKYTLSADLSAHSAIGYDVIPAESVNQAGPGLRRVPIPLRVDRGPLVNLNLGLERLFAKSFGVGLGAFTNLTSAPDITTNSAGFLLDSSSRLSNVHMVGGTFTLGFFRPHSLTRLGVSGTTGWGRMVQPSNPTNRFDEGVPPLQSVQQTQSFVYVFISSSFRFTRDKSYRRGEM